MEMMCRQGGRGRKEGAGRQAGNVSEVFNEQHNESADSVRNKEMELHWSTQGGHVPGCRAVLNLVNVPGGRWQRTGHELYKVSARREVQRYRRTPITMRSIATHTGSLLGYIDPPQPPHNPRRICAPPRLLSFLYRGYKSPHVTSPSPHLTQLPT